MVKFIAALLLTTFTLISSATETIIYDLDGTLTNLEARVVKFITNRTTEDVDEDGFYLAADADLPMDESINQLRIDFAAGYNIEIWTGRGAIAKDITIHWLNIHKVPYHKLKMRPIGEKRPTHVVKTEWYKAFIKTNGKTIIRVYDDTECNWTAFPAVADVRIPLGGKLRLKKDKRCNAKAE